MSTWHEFGQNVEDFDFDFKANCWTDVIPGDMVRSRGTMAYRLDDFADRNSNTPVIRLYSAPVLVLALIPGVPDRPTNDATKQNTFVCLSRHGIIIVVTWAAERNA